MRGVITRLSSRNHPNLFLLSSFTNHKHNNQLRTFTSCSYLFKDEKSKQILKNLGLSLQKGNLASSTSSSDDSNNNNNESSSSSNVPDLEQQKEAIEKASASSSTSHQDQVEPLQRDATANTSPTSTLTDSNDNTNNDTTLNTTKTSNETNDTKTNDNIQTKADTTISTSENTIHDDDNHHIIKSTGGGGYDDQMYQLLQDAYDTTSHMTTDDIIIQINFDQGRQLFAFNSDHYLNRKQIIRNLPNEIDLFNKDDLAKIDDIYQQLQQLDHDKTTQMKYFKRYLKKYDDPIINLIQEFNGISKKFKLLRRKEIDNLSLSMGSYLYNENLFNLPYNVVGFDRSISGLPLRSGGKHELTEKLYPQEFIEDLQMFREKIPIHKRDLDFVELDDQESINIDPRHTSMNHSRSMMVEQEINTENLSTQTKLEQIDEFLDKFINNTKTQPQAKPQNSILVSNIEHYDSLDLRNDLKKKIESEVLLLKRTLQIEIENYLKLNLKNFTKLYLNNDQINSIRPNQYKLYDFSSVKPPNNSTIVIINYNFKDFSMLPPYSVVLNSRKQLNQLRNHLYKLFLINLDDQIDTLFRIKYLEEKDMKKFMEKTLKTIGNIISIRLLKLLKPYHEEDVDALLYSPYLSDEDSLNYKRIYWVNNQTRRKSLVTRYNHKNRDRLINKSALKVDYKKFDNSVEY
ncbi:hypothetical protein DFJ63DRAFT_169278 [Scheffersomyces coipomensis]|uniref:uncharacterized protein n=1 Tax=Scheffersomyces coipomensis TaxID=1788519 RepID=UPI00315D17D6